MTRTALSFAALALALPLASLSPGPDAAYAQDGAARSWTSVGMGFFGREAPGPTLSAEQTAVVREGLEAARRGDWAGVRAALSRATALPARQLLTWRLATADPRVMSFGELRAALQDLSGFPQSARIRAAAEAALPAAGLSAQDQIAWLGADGGPVSAEGKIALAQAYLNLARVEEARAAARALWREEALNTGQQAAALQAFGALLTPADHAARIDMLLWRERRTQAASLLPLAPGDRAGAFQARIRFATGAATPSDEAAGLSAEPAVIYERAKALRRAGDRAGAMALLLQIRDQDLPLPAREALWDERRAAINEAIRQRDWSSAYALASRHGLSRGEDFADGEFLAGWLSLRFLNAPQQAARHFRTLDDGVRAPISKARAGYWRGRAAEAQGDRAAAQAFYAAAARHSTAFYGQLAAQELSEAARLRLPAGARPTDADRARFAARPMTAIAQIAAEAGDAALFRSFALALDDQLDSDGEHQLLAEMARAQGEPAVAVRTAKTGVARGVIAPDAAFPLPPLPQGALGEGRAEPALVYAITRQESEFDTNAVSRAGARGLMQLMPATAQAVSRRLGVSYDFAGLTRDGGYNMMLGASYLGQRVNEFDGSYILAVASYNAGAARIRQWIGQYGDPRLPGVDAIDWIEMIPFQETRNYVHRVLENVQIYRARMAGGEAELTLRRDLARGQAARSGAILIGD